ncbi:hypothetical protein [Streptomyces aidingensis]|uniref:Uncharacterized protein n=1 Tax=Streptomyces aidingensis TaxID=910347 RepID=A0A1I1EDS6_9ACTN|nr:hypothetical protein [Streptomyces aidingensis]SFB85289.1 hypothetical protein SAMN05421773_101264 [Streptomyces aidingensis]
MSRDSGSTFGGFVLAVLIGAGAGALLYYVLDEEARTAAEYGAGVFGIVLLTYLITSRLTGTRPAPGTGGRITELPRRPETFALTETEQWLGRARNAAQRLQAHRESAAADGTLGAALADAASHARTASEQLTRRVAAVTVIDAATSGGEDSRELRGEQMRLEREAAALPEGGAVRRAKEASARAVGERAASRERMEELRTVLVATVETLTLRLEAAAEHGGMLLSLRAADDAAATALDLTPLTTELEAVQAGLEELEALTQRLLTDS